MSVVRSTPFGRLCNRARAPSVSPAMFSAQKGPAAERAGPSQVGGPTGDSVRVLGLLDECPKGVVPCLTGGRN